MATSKILIALSICLTLQLATAFPYDDTINSIEDNEVIDKTVEIQFRKLLRPVIFKTLTLLQQHSNTLITETATFADSLLVELKLLPNPEQDGNIFKHNLIGGLTELLQRIEKLNLYDDSAEMLREKAAILREIAKMFRSFEAIMKTKHSNKQTAVLKQIFVKLELRKLNERVGKSVKDSVEKFTNIFVPFWNTLSYAEKQEHPKLIAWYGRFEAAQTAQEKFKSLVEFVQILKGIVLQKE